MEYRDRFDRVIKLDDYLVSPGRASSSCWLVVSKVVGLAADGKGLKVQNEQGKKTFLSAGYRRGMVVDPRGIPDATLAELNK